MIKFLLGAAVVSVIASLGITEVEATLPDTIVRVGATATPGVTWGVFVVDTFAYIADRGATTVVNASDPSNPWVISTLIDPDAWSLGIFVKDTVAYLNFTALASEFSTLNVSNPASLSVLGWISVPTSSGPEPTGISVVDTVAFLANGDDGLTIINVSSPVSMDTIRIFDTPGNAIDLDVKDSLVFIADLDSLQIVNVADPMSPFRVGAVSVPNGCYGIDVIGNFAYVVCQSSSGNNGSLQVIDISNPASPQIVGSANNINGDPVDVQVQGNFAYVAATDHFLPNVEGGVRVIDISDSLNPILVASYDTPGDPRGIFAVFPYIYVADQDSLQILEHIITGVEEKDLPNQKPQVLTISQNYPNPFNHSTLISYQLPTSSRVTLRIYDVLGRVVKTLVDKQNQARHYIVHWDGKTDNGRLVPNGSYFYQLKVGSQHITKKFIKLGFRFYNQRGNQYA